jgi:hypothetical protein
MPVRATQKKKAGNAANLSSRELALVNAMVNEVAVDKFRNLNSESWNEARENLKKSPIEVSIRPELRTALSKAVNDLKKIPAPTLMNLLKLWHAATSYRVAQTQSKSK